MPRERFDPQAEFAVLRKTPDAERASQFWLDRTKQRKEIATVAALVIERVFQEPDVAEAELLSLVEEFSEDIRLAPYQEKLARDLIRASRKRRQEILRLRQQFPDDKELLRHAHPRNTRGPILHARAAVCPLSIHFAVDKATYARMTEEKENMGQSGGFFAPSGKMFTYQKGFDQRWGTSLHEEMHALYAFFREHLSRHLKKTLFVRPLPSLAQLQKRIHAEGVAHPLREHLTELLHASADRIKDELFAFSRAGRGSGRIMSALLTTEEKKGLYDYFASDLTRLAIAIAGEKISDRDYELAREIMEMEFLKMHKELIENGLGALKTLLVYKKWTFMEAAFFFVDVPLERWPEEIRLLKQLEG